MLKFIKNLFDEDKKTLDKYQVIVDQINALEPEIKKLSDSKLAAQTKKFKKQISEEHGFMAVFIDSEGNRVALHSRA